MFDLNEEVKQWRVKLFETDSISETEADELESHLRDSFGELQLKLGNSQEALWLAKRRIGSPELIALEFSKLQTDKTWVRRAQWMLAGYLLLSLLFGVVGILGSALTHFAIYQHLPLWLAFVLSSVGVTVCVLAVVLWTWRVTDGRSSGLQSVAQRFGVLVRSGQQYWLMAALVLFLVFQSGAQMFGNVVVSRFLSPEHLGYVSIVRGMTNVPGRILILCTVVASLCWLLRHDSRQLRKKSNTRLALVLLVLVVAITAGFGMLSLGVAPLFGPTFAAF